MKQCLSVANFLYPCAWKQAVLPLNLLHVCWPGALHGGLMVHGFSPEGRLIKLVIR